MSVALAVVSTLLIAGYFRQWELGRKVVDLEARLHSAEIEARDAANRTTRAREQATELIDFFVENLREELEPIGRTDIIESAASQAEAYFERLPPDAIGAGTNFHHAKMLGNYAGFFAWVDRVAGTWSKGYAEHVRARALGWWIVGGRP